MKPSFICVLFGAFCLSALSQVCRAQDAQSFSPNELKKLSVEDLMNVDVTSVSRTPENLPEAASAIQVLRNEDIRRSSATRLPEALRLASNLQVAQSNSHDWAVTARGFNGAPLTNNTLAAKLLVMIDGRTVYTPLFGGVFWDVQNVLLNDIDRIEVVSGPGGTLWGANAMNGVINVISKSSRETQGLYLTGAGGSFLELHAAARYGGKINDKMYYRVYGQRFQQESTSLGDGTDGMDMWNMNQAGFRMDYYPSEKNTLTIQGDFYIGEETDDMGDVVDGQNLLARWTRQQSNTSGIALQVYYDRTWRRLPEQDFSDDLQTYDVDFQHRFSTGSRHRLLWGVGYRLMIDDVHNTSNLSFFPEKRTMPLVNVFLQDKISIVRKKLDVTIGSKLLHNVYTGYEVQPSLRAAWTVDQTSTLWGAVSRAVRAPSRFDVDESTPSLNTPPGFKSETVVTYELGYRLQPVEKIALSLATFYSRFDDLRSINNNPSASPPFTFRNDLSAKSAGVEMSINYYASERWRLRGGYTFLKTEFTFEDPSVVDFSDDFEAIDPKSQFIFQSILDMPNNFQFDMDGRFVHRLDQTIFTPLIHSYFTFNVRVAWQYKRFVVAVVGQNLVEGEHSEFGSRQIPRSFFGRITCRLW